MKLLIVTQAVDEQDQALGFFVRWIGALAPEFEQVEVICLKEGKHALPANLRVHSLRKERGRPMLGSLAYAVRFMRLAWQLRSQYDAVFVHMNQEYVVLAGWLWKLLGKRIYMWRNHYAGSLLTTVAALFCTKIFCTSKHSYTARFRRTVLMPVGVDTARFHADTHVTRAPRSILFLARVAPSKRPDMFIEALGMLVAKGVSFTASLYGSPLPQDERYYESLKQRVDELGLHDRLRFHAAVSNEHAAPVYAAHEIFVNCSPSGMFDKTLFEAAACGCTVLAVSDDFAQKAGEEFQIRDAASLARGLQSVLSGAMPRQRSVELAHAQSLEALVKELSRAIAGEPGMVKR